MDHQVEHDSHIHRAAGVRSGAEDLDVAWLGNVRLGGDEGRVEPLDVSHLQNERMPFRESHQLFGIGDAGRNRLLDKNMDTASEQLRGNGVVKSCRRGDDGGIDLPQQRAKVRESGNMQIVRDGGASGFHRIDDADQLRFFHAAEQPGMDFAEMTDTHDRNT